MAYDPELADRIRALLSEEPALREQKMFGGLGFMINGNMAVAASSRGGLLVRVDPDDAEALVDGTSVTMMQMRGRSMRGWLFVEAEAVRTARGLRAWVDRGASHARGLPPKP